MVTEYSGTSTGTGYIMFTGSSTSYSSNGYHGLGTVISGNHMSNGDSTGAGPYHGISDYRNSTNGTGVSLVIDDNEIEDVYYYFTRLYYTKDATVTNNDLHSHRGDAGTTYTYSFYNYYGGNIVYENNEIHDMDAYYNYVSYLYQCSGTSGSHSTYNNNHIYNLTGNYNYFNRIYYSDYIEVDNNIMENNDAGSYNYYAFYLQYCDYSSIQNNTYENNSASYFYYGFYMTYCDYSVNSGNTYSNNRRKLFLLFILHELL